MYLKYLGDDEKIILKKAQSISEGLNFTELFNGRGLYQITIISESGLYKLVMRSDKPQAKPFQDWVTKVVLPAIRKDGAYVMGEEKVSRGASARSEAIPDWGDLAGTSVSGHYRPVRQFIFRPFECRLGFSNQPHYGSWS